MDEAFSIRALQTLSSFLSALKTVEDSNERLMSYTHEVGEVENVS